jgi:surface antigen
MLVVSFTALALSTTRVPAAHADGTNTVNVTVTGSGYPSGGNEMVGVVADSWPGALCSARVASRGLTQSLPRVRASSLGGIRWHGSVAPGIRSGDWQAEVDCENQPTGDLERGYSVRFPVAGRPPLHGTADHLLVVNTVIGEPNSHKPVPGPSGGAGDEQSSRGRVEQTMREDPYPLGECTWWVWFKRPDLPLFVGSRLGAVAPARNWYRAAAAAGLAVGRSPQVASVAVFQPGQGPRNGRAGREGHVAYVLAVRGMRIRISEANFRNTPPGHTRWVPWEGLKFIYGDGRGGAKRGSIDVRRPSAKPVPSRNPTPGGPPVYRYFVYDTCANGQCGLAMRIAPSLVSPQVGPLLPDNTEVDIICQTDGESVEGVKGFSSDVWDQLNNGFYVPDYYVDTPGSHGLFSTPIPICGRAETPPPPPSLPPAPSPSSEPPPTHPEQQGHLGVNTFTDPYNATGLGPRIEAGQIVNVYCKVYAPQIESANPDGYWYRIASTPWSGSYYSPANTFLDGDPWDGPYTHNTDFAVPNC